ncbi:hypothetical protein [Alicyclobacillus fodiniaquatilis]|uniref:Uncharacterized protein n=1 Tax=Alicyclobacillus fodiniaquatilis TaxID=1661150 RepID=A0ABW4JEG8_9BACL
MFSMRSRRITPKLFIIPILMICLFVAIVIFEYSKQHVHVQMLGQSMDVSNVEQVLVEPSATTSQPTQQYYTLTDQASILKLCKLLGTAQLYQGSEGDFATNIANLLFQSTSNTISIPIAQTSTNVILIFFNDHTYLAPAHFLETLQQFATDAKKE